jgi:hypothetical protein
MFVCEFFVNVKTHSGRSTVTAEFEKLYFVNLLRDTKLKPASN